jgi:hypothetical protein
LNLDIEIKYQAHNRGAHPRSGRQAAGLTAEPSGEVPCSGARRRDKAERSERRGAKRTLPPVVGSYDFAFGPGFACSAPLTACKRFSTNAKN